MHRGKPGIISQGSPALLGHLALITIGDRPAMTDEIPHVPKQECTQEAGHVVNLNLGIGVIDVVA